MGEFRNDQEPRMGHEAEIIIPGSFVVLQGMAGDVVANTMDTPPALPEELDLQQLLTLNDSSSSSSSSSATVAPAATSSTLDDDDFMDADSSAGSSCSGSSSSMAMVDATGNARGAAPPPTVGLLVAQNTTLGGLTGLVAPSLAKPPPPPPPAAAAAPSTTSSQADSFVVVTDHEDAHDDHPPQDLSSPRATRPTAPCNTTSRPSSSTATTTNPLPLHAQEALEEWNRTCRLREQAQRIEWQESGALLTMDGGPLALDHIFMRRRDDFWWLTANGRIAVFRDIPTQLSNGNVLKSVIGSLAPGSTVVATDIVYLDSKTLQRIQVPPVSASGGSTFPHRIYPRGRPGWICFVKVDACSRGRTGYAALSLDGYSLLAPGLPSMYTDPNCWIWRVTCLAGAFVREGLELNTNHIATLPYGSLVRVTRRTVNSQGLCRLRVSAMIEEDTLPPSASTARASASFSTSTTTGTTDSPTARRRHISSSSNHQTHPYSYPPLSVVVDGWCSEFLNPLSGNRGSVLEPLSFPVPALYKVTLPIGAVIRSDVELSARQFGTLPQGAMVKVVGRAFSEHPVECCLERLKLAGDGAGWISVRLNRPRPHNELVVEFIDTDSSFDPETPGLYHWKESATIRLEEERHQQQSSDDTRELSSIDSDAVSSGGDSEFAKAQRCLRSPNSPLSRSCTNNGSKCGDPRYNSQQGSNNTSTCLICLTEERNATIVHGETGHVACCLVCSRILKARGDRCPVCRLHIDLVIQHFWA